MAQRARVNDATPLLKSGPRHLPHSHPPLVSSSNQLLHPHEIKLAESSHGSTNFDGASLNKLARTPKPSFTHSYLPSRPNPTAPYEHHFSLLRLTTHTTSSSLTPATLAALLGPLLFGLGSPALPFHHTMEPSSAAPTQQNTSCSPTSTLSLDPWTHRHIHPQN
ncbi:hypothetical protein M422DRAFT_272311 [Sphaerobolus stellatus SS14]|uniref:Uncharacterized protein n=1 Tax=Sphaerobolus stellatus (strain SS14) TaxID=990650 RepID=A0A0C9UMU8_SPHS4|nr:hypothetical protein M422DRAFT_272311 [Sphaerobolus stellatus SS14]